MRVTIFLLCKLLTTALQHVHLRFSVDVNGLTHLDAGKTEGMPLENISTASNKNDALDATSSTAIEAHSAPKKEREGSLPEEIAPSIGVFSITGESQLRNLICQNVVDGKSD